MKLLQSTQLPQSRKIDPELQKGLLHVEMQTTAHDLQINKKIRIIQDNMLQLSKYDISLDEKSPQLTKILGGMDKVLDHYLSTNVLSEIQLQQINNILEQLQKDRAPAFENKYANIDRSVMYLYTSDTLWHNCFRKSLANRIKNFIFGKYMAYFIVVLSCAFVIDQIITNFPFYHLCYRLPLNISAVTAASLLSVSANKYLWGRTLWTFDFLVKTGYAIRLFICGVIYEGYDMLSFWDYLATAQTVVAISLIDGFPFPNKVKIIATIAIALNYSSYAFDWTFQPKESIVLRPFNSDSFTIDIDSLIAGSYRIITLFVWKQAFQTIWRKNSSTTIRRRVKLKWIDS